PLHDNGRLVEPEEIEAYRSTHHFRGPPCLCTMLDNDDTISTKEAIFESKVENDRQR
ncbi:hypothetical protein H0H81_006153, partial [Sphagnurus paluster]